ncbi:MAG: CDGSH iron-sulfur domain-containing protein [Candidatus Eisenbacteria bacterium]
MSDPHIFKSQDIGVTWNKRRCIHSAECVRGLPAVFEPGRKAWIVPENASADEVAAIIARCPTGALQFERHDGGAAETPDAENCVRVSRHGPLELRGDLEIATAGGEALRETRVSLCRCGRSRNPPFCDGSHHPAGFRDAGEVLEGRIGEAEGALGPLRVGGRLNGPLRLAGPLTIVSADGRVRRAGGEVALCRCGLSRNKPFCDSSHRDAGFEAAEF